MAHTTTPTTSEKEPTATTAHEAAQAFVAKLRPSSKGVIDALTKAAGDVLMRSKLPNAEKAKLSNGIMDLAGKFGEIARAAWGGEG